MPHRFRDLAIALKLNLVQGLVLLAIILAATGWTASHLRQQLTQTALDDLKQINRLAVSMFETYDRSLRNDIERSGRLFSGSFDKPFELLQAGAAPQLLHGGTRIDDRLDLTDTFTAKAGTVATILLRQGDDFLRAATSLKKEDGARATGTLLGTDHPARPSLLAGNPYTGKATLFGRDFMTHYVPVRDASGKVIGAFFAGLEFTEGLQALKKSILAIKIGSTGYVAALDAGKQKGVATIHPAKEGANLLAAKDSLGFEFIREMVDKKSGSIRYEWANPGESSAREKVAVFDHFPAWDWVVVSTSYVEEISGGANAAVRNIAWMALVIIAAALLSGFVMTRQWVTQPLQEIALAADRIAAGDLTGRLTGDSADEVGRLKQAIGKMSENLQTTVSSVRKASSTMLEQSLALVTAAEKVSGSAQVQRDAATGMAASVEEMSVSIDQVAEHAHAAQGLSVSSGQAASQGAEVIHQAVGAMNQITGFVRQASTTVSELGRRSQDISAVVQVIREIADQTNLLALNAAIEAARAGEQGRGFAVVADEVRKLAERTATSTHSISEMIGHIQDGAKAAVHQMEDGVAQVEQGGVLADRAGQAIGEIEGRTNEVITTVGSISGAIREQSLASQTIAQGVEQIAQMAEASYSASQGTAQSAQALRDLAAHLDQALGHLRVR
ncbi:MAG: methyl-accepting chemotaxis protein [Candidatus Accumulibacter sp.]|uniref:methyl-accepting chemotaxis protein n=1 Tax=Accumulibacter sp. TaxID=2053492 RepID=UPI001A44F358|nr:methyl-accepting chemotaxis protein [Accumulibacter sp.]MCC2868374.1 methyl-accepting chemotaxis protein [Candidatus Accumulibacter phosphatis]MBL8402758.1 methyl-accepting chemotaxis protein [Accumulibacter sp.]MBN8517996.1 methyl-accepting chemotaxis protein [Accumulibacter sp.]MBO3710411.1 methyl-accepting chemotaxis protein [Accumulibacter sp.]MCM8578698.1 methyl-accepting chemotaxis protein [Accumulibacter sp.]